MTTPAITATGPVVTTTRVTRTSTRRWAVALAIALVALGGTAGAFWLAAGASPAARLAGWAPAGSVAYGEMRLDATADRDGAVARFLANCPGFADRSRLDEKLTQLGDRLVGRATGGTLSYSSMKPWLGDAAAIAIPRVPAGKSDGTGVLIVATTDAPALRDWIAASMPAGGTGGTADTYRGVELVTRTYRGMAWAYTVLDTVLLAGERSAVEAAIDTGGSSTFATSTRFRTALAAVEAGSIAFGYLDGEAVSAAIAADGARSSSDGSAAIAALARDALPAWVAVSILPTDDALEAIVVAPRPALLAGESGFPELRNEGSELAARLPADALAVAETRDLGPALVALVERVLADADAAAGGPPTGGAIDLLGLAGNARALVGWMGDGALVVRGGTTAPEAGIVAFATDEAAASATARQLTALLGLATGGQGIETTSEPYGDGQIVTIVAADAEALARSLGTALGADVPPASSDAPARSATLSWTVQRGLFVAGESPAFVKAVLDAAAGGSLASSDAYRAALERAGRSNAGELYLDVPGILERLVPALPADERDAYERDLAPFADQLSGAAGVLLAGDPMRVEFVLTVK